MGDYINVIIGRDNDEILKRIYNVNNGCDTVLILFGIDNLRVSSACKSVKKTYICNDEYAAMMILSSEFGYFDGIFAELTNETLKDIYTKNKKYYSEKYVFNFVSTPGVLTVPERRVAARRRVRKIFEKTKLGKLYSIIRKICHIDIEQKILVADGRDIPKNTSAFGFVQITEENLESLYKDKSVIAEARELLRLKNTYGLAMTDGEKVIGRGFIKGRGSADRVFRIKSENSYVITFMNVEDEYRGKRLQQLIAGELVDRFVKNRHDCRVFAYVYYYNIPSLRNLSNFGFKIYENKNVIRLAKHTLNKETI